ncbi:MAG: hypothetical protein JSU87_15465 [Gemmatimonadota bacterium]|nr:MAG: hypothetical protein JSU87_15465 [Gemmatimonadota bacterium]
MNRLFYRLSLPLTLALLLGACEEGLEPVPFQGISGTVRLIGQPPDSTEWVRLVIYRELPQTDLDLLGFVSFSDPLDLSEREAAYVLALEPGLYRWLPVVWKKEGAPLAPEALRAAGWYSVDGEPFAVPDTVRVTAEAETADVDLTADFENMLTVDELLEILEGLQ